MTKRGVIKIKIYVCGIPYLLEDLSAKIDETIDLILRQCREKQEIAEFVIEYADPYNHFSYNIMLALAKRLNRGPDMFEISALTESATEDQLSASISINGRFHKIPFSRIHSFERKAEKNKWVIAECKAVIAYNYPNLHYPEINTIIKRMGNRKRKIVYCLSHEETRKILDDNIAKLPHEKRYIVQKSLMGETLLDIATEMGSRTLTIRRTLEDATSMICRDLARPLPISENIISKCFIREE